MSGNKAIEIEGELDEEDFQESQKTLEVNQGKESLTGDLPTFNYSKLENIEQMIKGIQNYYEKEVNSAIATCENLSFHTFLCFALMFS